MVLQADMSERMDLLKAELEWSTSPPRPPPPPAAVSGMQQVQAAASSMFRTRPPEPSKADAPAVGT